MPIESSTVKCPQCCGKFTAPKGQTGLQCPHCGNSGTIPSGEAPKAVEPETVPSDEMKFCTGCRDQMVREFQRDERWYMDKYSMRNRIEHGHGMEKRQTELKESHVENIDGMDIHVGLHCVSLLSMVLVRLQNGITDGLVNLGGLV